MKFRIKILLSLLCLICSVSFAAKISVSPIEIDLTAEQTYADITVSNVGRDTAYVSLQPLKVQNPGAANVQYETMHNNPREFGLVVTPLKVVIPPSLSRKIRVMSLVQNNAKDVIYLIKIVPSEGEMQVATTDTHDILAGIQVISGYNALVTVRPIMPQPALSLKRHNNALTVSNTGNTQVLLSNAEQCDAKGVCSKLNLAKRMYANSIWQVNLPVARPVHFLETYFQNQYRIVESN